MKRIFGLLTHPALVVSLIVGGVIVWAQAETTTASEESPRYKAPHPATCHGCKLASGEQP